MLLMCDVITAQPEIVSERLSDDGILVVRGGEARALAGSWRVWVTLQAPTVPTAFLDGLQRVNYILDHKILLKTSVGETNVNDTLVVDPIVKASWIGRIQRMRLHADSSLDDARRKRRGLVDPLGMLANVLFGVATEAEVEELRRAVDQLSDSQSDVIHHINMLTSVVNKTREYQNENRERLNVLNRRFRAIQMYLPRLTNQINYLAMQVEFERIIEDLELQWDTVRAAEQRFITQHRDLQLLHLTEVLLTPTTLNNILSAGTTTKKMPLPTEWYYMYANVRPLWTHGDHLIFEVKLPFVQPVPYILHKITAWPVPVAPHTAARLTIDGTFGYDIRNKHLFTAANCQGRNPTVCPAQPVWAADSQPCVNGIITGDQKLTNSCSVEVSQQNNSLIANVRDNEYVFSTWGETVRVRCSQMAPTYVRYQRGAYRLILPPECDMYGKQWTVSAFSYPNTSITPAQQRNFIRPTILNLTRLFQIPKQQWNIPQPLSDLRPITTLPVRALSVRTHHRRGEWKHRGDWALWLAWVIAGAALIIGGAWIAYYGKTTCRRRCKDGKPCETVSDAEAGGDDVTASFIASLSTDVTTKDAARVTWAE
jgi:hypothetical protein